MSRFILAILILTSWRKNFSQDLILDNGIYIEKPIFNDTSQNRYSIDNISYKLNTIFVYDYYFIDKLGNKNKFMKDESFSTENPMNLINLNDSSQKTITDLIIFVNNPLKFFANDDSVYTQTLFNYFYTNKGNNDALFYNNQEHWEEITGVVDNKKNLWIHPPRSYSFKILELNPFPFYNLDTCKKSWHWKLSVGGSYLDSRWINWTEIININYNYVRSKDEILSTSLGKIKCKTVSAVANFEYGDKFAKTYLKSYYHQDYGFVKLDYTNIDGTKIVIELKEVKKLTVEVTKPVNTFKKFEQKCCLEYFSENLTLNQDSTFKYIYENKGYTEQHKGKWKFKKDTLILSDYSLDSDSMEILSGKEEIVLKSTDSIQIAFYNSKTLRPILPKLFINGKCVKSFPNNGSIYFLPKQDIKSISTKTGVYYVKNKMSNAFNIYYEPNFYKVNTDRIKNISKCLISNDSLFRIDCDGSLDKNYLLNSIK